MAAKIKDDTVDLVEEVSRDQVALHPGDAADPQGLVDAKIPADIRETYEVHSYRSAAVILAESHPELFEDLCGALRAFRITTTMIRTAGGNESEIPKLHTRRLAESGSERLGSIGEERWVARGETGRRTPLGGRKIWREHDLDGQVVVSTECGPQRRVLRAGHWNQA